MAIYYLQKVTNLKNVERTVYKPRFDKFETKTTKDMAKHLAKHGFCSEGFMMGAMSYLAQYLAEQMREGNKVVLDGIGEFSPSLAMEDFHEMTSETGTPFVRAEGLHIDKVSFRPSKELIREANRDLHLTRSKFTDTVIPEERAFTQEERMTLLNQHFQENTSITIKEYAQLTFLPRTAANAELHRLANPNDGILTIEGSGSHIRFVKK